MSYVQYELNGNFLTREYYLNPSYRSNGYPGYGAAWGTDRGSVLTILYEDESGNIWLSEDKEFKLVILPGTNYWVFSANPVLEAVNFNNYSNRWIKYQWRREWANQKNSNPNKVGLVWPYRTWQEAWEWLYVNRQTIHIRKDQGPLGSAWIAGSDVFGTSRFLSVGLSWRPIVYQSKAPFRLAKVDDGRWGLQFMAEAYISGNEGALAWNQRFDPYVAYWRIYDAERWQFGQTPDSFDVNYVGNGQYFLSDNDLPLNISTGDSWWNGVYDGVEFARNNNPQFTIHIVAIIPNLSPLQAYMLGYQRFITIQSSDLPESAYVPDPSLQIMANMPDGGGLCNSNSWDGTQISCMSNIIPYVAADGLSQCMTVEDFQNDIHCQQWGISNRGELVENRLMDICRNNSVNGNIQNPSVCACFLPNQVYYDTIQGRLGTGVANALRATQGLQCESGLCPQGPTLSAQVYYRDGRKCDYCIQNLTLNLQVANNQGNVRIDQTCLQPDISWTWETFIGRLEAVGARRIVRGTDGTTTSTGNVNSVIINQDASRILLVTTNPRAQEILRESTLLSMITTKDQNGNIILTRTQWSGNSTAFSTEVLFFLLNTRDY